MMKVSLSCYLFKLLIGVYDVVIVNASINNNILSVAVSTNSVTFIERYCYCKLVQLVR